MEPLALFGPLGDTALLLGLSATRVAVAFLLIPLFTAELIPALVRNAMFMAIALLSLAMQPSAGPLVLSTWQWIALFAKEAFIGATLGVSGLGETVFEPRRARGDLAPASSDSGCTGGIEPD